MNRPCVAIAPYEDGARYSRVRLWLLLACILCQPVSQAQSAVTEELTDRSGDYRYPPRSVQFTQITRSDGLSQSAIHAIMQDSNGYMWLGTQEGLNRYDGYEMVVYENDVTDRDSLSHDWIWSLFSDQQGNVWVGTNGGGLNRFDARQNRFTRFIFNDLNCFPSP
jgi:ligand-binding sensor domain-containing protein